MTRKKQTYFLWMLACFLQLFAVGQVSVRLPGGVRLEETLDDSDLAAANFILKANERIQDKIAPNIFVKAVLSKRQCFVGEPILVTYKLYTRLYSQSKVAVQPAFTGCTVKELTTNDVEAATELINGRAFKTYIVRKVAIVPLKPGNLTIDVLRVDNDISFCKNAIEFNNQSPSIHTTFSTTSAPATVVVQPLPFVTKNATAAVGAFWIEVRAVRPLDTVGKTNQLRITIKGKGNFDDVVIPAIAWPKAVMHFRETTDQNVNELQFPAEGEKTFTVPFTVGQVGDVVINPILFTYFNPEKAGYVTVSSDSIRLHILPKVAGAAIASITTSDVQIMYWLVGGIVLLLVLLLLWRINSRKQNSSQNVLAQKEEMVDVAAMPIVQPFWRAQREQLLLLEDNKHFYTQTKLLVQQLEGVEGFEVRKLEALVKLCDEVLYAPLPVSNKAAVVVLLEEL